MAAFVPARHADPRSLARMMGSIQGKPHALARPSSCLHTSCLERDVSGRAGDTPWGKTAPTGRGNDSEKYSTSISPDRRRTEPRETGEAVGPEQEATAGPPTGRFQAARLETQAEEPAQAQGRSPW